MKKLNQLDYLILIIVAAAVAFSVIVFARSGIAEAKSVQITFSMTEDIESARYIKIGDEFWIDDVAAGTVAAMKSLEGGGIAITINASVLQRNGATSIDGLMLKLGKRYTFSTKRIIGSAVCESISGE